MIFADDRLRAATQAVADHATLAHARAVLANDVAAEEQRVQQLTAELAKERRDVEELTRGVLGFLASLALSDQVEREQREAMEAEVRLREALASRDSLRAQLASLDARLAAATLPQLEAEVAAARAAKRSSVIDEGGPKSTQIQDLAIRMQSIDIELVSLEEAVTAGDAAIKGMARILALLGRARMAPEQASAQVTEARGLVGETQARATWFHRSVEALAAPDDVTPPYADAISDDDRQAFADPWIRKLFGPGSRESRLDEAQAAMLERQARVQRQLSPVRARRDELAARRVALAQQTDALLAPG